MKKPESRVLVEGLDYHECERYIAHKMGIEDLRDVLGTFRIVNGEMTDCDVEYQNFWHVVMDQNGVNNPCWVYLTDAEYSNNPDWSKSIFDMFEKEFGDVAYWVEW